MALANVACLLAEQQILISGRVLVIDWDLEAPGLHKFFSKICERPENVDRPGIINYFFQLSELLEETPSLYNELEREDGWETLNRVHPIEDYLILDVQTGIDLIKAGRLNSRYAEKVASFNWVSFYERFGSSLMAFRKLLTNKYSYCLIDSRTGFTDTSGICTMLLPEKLVIVFTPNKQSSQGAVELAERAIKYRRSSADLRPLSIFPLPSRIDDAEESLRKQWRTEYQNAFERVFQMSYDLESCDLTGYFDEVKLPYKSYYAYGETLAVLNERNESLTLHRAYKTFSDMLTTLESSWYNFDSAELTSKEEPLSRIGQIKKIAISSTMRDLPEHRQQVMDACQRLGMFYPEMMENLTATDANAMEVSLRMVSEADIYLGVFGFRYGYVPPNETISVTEMEYNHAVARGIPCLIFLMSDDHHVKPSDVETGEGAKKLKELKDRLLTERVVGFFTSADDLRGQVIQALVSYRESDPTKFHYVSEIPTAPEVYIAHPYTLLQTHRLIGRQMELRLLTDWVTKRREQIYGARILSIIAIGGMGKSALTWKWFTEIAPQEMNPLAGRMWWSFYESDATFENFVTRALAYVTGRPLDEAQKLPPTEREAQLLAALDREPFLLALDGIERILVGYARMDASRLIDNQDKAKINLRKTADPRAGRFLKKLAQVKSSRILASSRLYPADLEMAGGDPLPGTFRLDIEGLTDDDAIELWRAFEVSGSRDELLPVFTTFDKHPLLIQALAGEIKRYRPASGNFQEWRKAHPHFDPAQFPRLQEAMGHVLEFALQNLSDKDRQVLHIIAAFRMPASYDTLTALLIGEGKPCAAERELDALLTELEDRGLIGWDKRANRYDLHPIVRGVVWSGLADNTRRAVYTTLQIHFDSLPKIDDWEDVNSLEDLMPAIELYNTLIGLGRYDDAEILFCEQINKATLYRLNASRQRAELLEMLFPDGLDKLPRLSSPSGQAFTLEALALAYQYSGQPNRAAPLYRRNNIIRSEMEDDDNLAIGLDNLSAVLRLMGLLYESEAAARHALGITRKQNNRFDEGVSLSLLGWTLAARGVVSDSELSLQRSLLLASLTDEAIFELSYLAEHALWLGKHNVANNLANRAWNSAIQYGKFERGFILAARLQGAAALALNGFAKADERLHYALTRARAVNYVEEELPALIALAELRRRQNDLKAARELLDDVWEYAEREPYPLHHADACNVLAQVERDEGNHAAAVEAATQAYQLAWCDGPPFAYHWGLEKARKHLQELGAGEPQLPPFDESKYEPMPDVEIDPEDEFHVGNTSDD